MELFKKLKERISPVKRPTPASPERMVAKRSITSSEDDPFNDKPRKALRTFRLGLNAESNLNNSPFIRNRNVSQALSYNTKDVSVSSDAAATHAAANKTTVVEEEGTSVDGEEMLDEIEKSFIELEKQDQEQKDNDYRDQKQPPQPEHKEPVIKVVEQRPLSILQTRPSSDLALPAEEDEVSLEVLEDMNKLEECFPILSTNYRLIDKIGEGTFSKVYKAEALNGSVKLGTEIWKSPPLKQKTGKKGTTITKRKNPIVALKQIYVTSSPNRIHNELNLLYTLSGNSHVAPLLDVLRFQDQVVAILPYYQHADFRDFYRDLPIKGIKKYLWEMFQALDFVHDKGVIHRDLKPTNFLYDPFKGKGVLVDFGLAEKMVLPSTMAINSKNSNICPCTSKDRAAVNRTHLKRLNIKAAYPKQDQRPPRRANRAGTRGFRAPEVLFKCTNQTTTIDIWSAGIIGFSLISRKFPLFNSPDDTDALVEIALIFGVEKLQKCAELHGCGLEINLANMNGNNGGNLIKVLADFVRHEEKHDCLPPHSVVYDTLKILSEKGDRFEIPTDEIPPPLISSANLEDSDEEDPYEQIRQDLENYEDHKQLLELLQGCFHMDPSKRLTAKQILKHPYFLELCSVEEDDVLL